MYLYFCPLRPTARPQPLVTFKALRMPDPDPSRTPALPTLLHQLIAILYTATVPRTGVPPCIRVTPYTCVHLRFALAPDTTHHCLVARTHNRLSFVGSPYASVF
ncbi:hypothetical protein BD311DRAFT_765024, partial [Dichomitus squalens]